MKKTTKILSLLVALAFCLTLSGCNFLDEIKASSAIITSEGTIKLYEGTEYKRIPGYEEFSPNFSYDFVDVVEKEIPVLLVSILSERHFDKSEDGRFLCETLDGKNIWYCRSDIYDEMLEQIQKGLKTETYCYSYWDYKTETTEYYKLSKSETDALLQVYSSPKIELPFEIAMLDFDYYADLYLCSDDFLFMKDTIDICIIDEKFYVIDAIDEYNFDIYCVPDELTKVFNGIFEKRFEEIDNWEEF